MDSNQTLPSQEFSSNKTKTRLAIGIGAFALILLAGGIWYASSGNDSLETVTKMGEIEETVAKTEPLFDTEPVQKVETEPRVFFNFDDATLTDAARHELDQWVARLKQEPSLKVHLEGHCDERGSRAYNLRLGQMRAESARAYLVGKGIEPERLSIYSYGEDRPLVSGKGESFWSQNRRVEIKPVEALSSR